jgi:hypothetical protein
MNRLAAMNIRVTTPSICWTSRASLANQRLDYTRSLPMFQTCNESAINTKVFGQINVACLSIHETSVRLNAHSRSRVALS